MKNEQLRQKEIVLRKAIFVIFLFALPMFCFAQNVAPSATSKDEKSQALTLTVKSVKKIYSLEDKIEVEVIIKNTSANDISLQAAPEFLLSSKSLYIWSPVKLDSTNSNLSAHEKMLLQLGPTQEKTFNYNLSQIKWDYQYSSLWPSKSLRALIQPGTYNLVFKIGIESSNLITIEVVEKEDAKDISKEEALKIAKVACDSDKECEWGNVDLQDKGDIFFVTITKYYDSSKKQGISIYLTIDKKTGNVLKKTGYEFYAS